MINLIKNPLCTASPATVRVIASPEFLLWGINKGLSSLILPYLIYSLVATQGSEDEKLLLSHFAWLTSVSIVEIEGTLA